MGKRLADFFASDSRIVLVVHLDDQLVQFCRSRADRRIMGPGGFLEGDDLHVIRLDRVGNEIRPTMIDNPALETAIERHWEMR
jgi:hypothetical protein